MNQVFVRLHFFPHVLDGFYEHFLMTSVRAQKSGIQTKLIREGTVKFEEKRIIQALITLVGFTGETVRGFFGFLLPVTQRLSKLAVFFLKKKLLR